MSTNSSEFGPDVILPTGEILQSPFYHYLVSKPASVFFVTVFTISTVLHFGQSVWYRMWWLIPTAVLSGAGEMAGWSGRLWSSIRPLNNTPFSIQIVATIIAPTPFLGAIFMTFSRLTKRLGTKYSRLSPRRYSRIFLTCDIISLFVQAGGGSITDNDNGLVVKIGTYIMLGGIAFQLLSLVVFLLLAVEYLLRYIYDRPLSRWLKEKNASDTEIDGFERREWDKRVKYLIGGLALMCFFILVRSVYRLIELIGGWTGKVIETQSYFIAFDGAMIWLALLAYNIFHPGLLLRDPDSEPKPEYSVGLESGFVPGSDTLLRSRT